MNPPSRRSIVKALLATVFLPLGESARWARATAASLSVEPLRPRPNEPLRHSRETYYRADALLSHQVAAPNPPRALAAAEHQ